MRTIIDHLRALLKIGYVYKGAHWAIYAIIEGEKLIKANNYDVIMSRSPSSELVALYLSKKYKIKWIANWNDPYPRICYPIPYGKGVNARLNKMWLLLCNDIVKNANIHTFPTERLCDHMISYMGISKEKTLIIPHICVDGLFKLKRKGYFNNKLRIIHSGNVSYPRSPCTLLEGLRNFKRNNPEVDIEITFVGKQDSNFCKLVDKFELAMHIKVLPPVDYVANLELMAGYDVALLIEANLEEGIFLPTKVGDYMQSSLPIWAVSPRIGVLNDLFVNGKIDYFSDVACSKSIAEELNTIYDDYLNERLLRRNIIDEYATPTIIDLYDRIL